VAFLEVVGAQIRLCNPDDNPIFKVQPSIIARKLGTHPLGLVSTHAYTFLVKIGNVPAPLG